MQTFRFLPLLLVGLVLVALPARAQQTPAAYDTTKVVPPPRDRVSPLQMARTNVGDAYVKVVYGSPRKRDRVVFGELVPYGEVWRLGANEATELTTSAPLHFGGEMLPAGTYSLWAIPQADRWTIVVSKHLGLWGTQYKDDADLFRFDVPTTTTPKSHEAFTVAFEKDAGGQPFLALMWDRTKVAIPLSGSH